VPEDPDDDAIVDADEVEIDDPDALADEDWSDFTYGQGGVDEDA
jgi:hypothetical protein